MRIRLSFLGACQNVTGSRYLLEANSTKVLVDCGLYQERHLLERNWDPFPTSPDTLDAVILTHAHLDHCGFLPKLVTKNGHPTFRQYANTLYLFGCSHLPGCLHRYRLIDFSVCHSFLKLRMCFLVFPVLCLAYCL